MLQLQPIMLIKSSQVSPAMGMPMFYAYLSVPVGCALMGIRLIGEIVNFSKNNFDQKVKKEEL